jgi:hypothetical protein
LVRTSSRRRATSSSADCRAQVVSPTQGSLEPFRTPQPPTAAPEGRLSGASSIKPSRTPHISLVGDIVVEERAQGFIARALNFLPDARPVFLPPAAPLPTEEGAGEAGHVAPLADAEDLPPTRHVVAPVRHGGLCAPLADRNRRERLARSPVALRAPDSVEAQATKVGLDPVVQSQSGRPVVRMRRGAAVDEGRLLLPRESNGYFGHKAARPRFSGLRYHSSSK